MNTLALATARVPSPLTAKSPSTTTKSAMVMLALPKKEKTSVPSANTMSKEAPPITMVSLTAAPVLLIRRPKLPPTSTPPAATEALPDRKPAIPVGLRTKAPSPSSRPWPLKVKLIPDMAMRVTVSVTPPLSRVLWSKKKLPARATPSPSPPPPMESSAPTMAIWK
ncbi:hypothetical protein [Desulfatiferula olefinivorans]